MIKSRKAHRPVIAAIGLVLALFLSACGAPETLHISVNSGAASASGAFSSSQATIVNGGTPVSGAGAGGGIVASTAVATSVHAIAGLRPVSQRDRSQYASDAQYAANAASACSAAAATIVLNSYGKNVTIADVLAVMQAHGALQSTGLSAATFPVLRDTLPASYGLAGTADADANMDSHVASIEAALAQAKPVMSDVYDATFFPGGHWIVLAGYLPQTGLPASDHGLAIDPSTPVWQEGGFQVLNPDPDLRNGRSVEQLWPVSTFKHYFTATHLSLIFGPK